MLVLQAVTDTCFGIKICSLIVFTILRESNRLLKQFYCGLGFRSRQGCPFILNAAEYRLNALIFGKLTCFGVRLRSLRIYSVPCAQPALQLLNAGKNFICCLAVQRCLIACRLRLCSGISEPVDYIDKIVRGFLRSKLDNLQRCVFIQFVIERVNCDLLCLKRIGNSLCLSLIFSRHVIKRSVTCTEADRHEPEHTGSYSISRLVRDLY